MSDKLFKLSYPTKLALEFNADFPIGSRPTRDQIDAWAKIHWDEICDHDDRAAFTSTIRKGGEGCTPPYIIMYDAGEHYEVLSLEDYVKRLISHDKCQIPVDQELKRIERYMKILGKDHPALKVVQKSLIRFQKDHIEAYQRAIEDIKEALE